MNATEVTDLPVQVQMGVAMLFFFACLILVIITGLALFGQNTLRILQRALKTILWACKACYIGCCLRICGCCSREAFYKALVSRGEDLMDEEEDTEMRPTQERDYIAEIEAIT